MNPWTILGWILLAVLALRTIRFVVIPLIGRLRMEATSYVRHLRTRNTPPAEGQTWANKYGECLSVEEVCPNGLIVLQQGCVSWGDDLDRWRQYVRQERMYLL